MKPHARKEGLLVRELDEETLVYDLERHRAYCLSPVAGLVWRHCDGRTSVDEMAGLAAAELDVPADPGLVWLTLHSLGRARLLRERPQPPAGAAWTRREVARRLAVAGAAALVPLVTSVVAPTSLQAATCLAGTESGRPCAASQCGRECGGSFCGTSSFFCMNIGGGNYRCVPPSAGTCP